MNPGGYYNRPAAEWARQNIKGRVEVRTLFNSTKGKVFTYSLLFCVPAAFFVVGVAAIVSGVKDKTSVYAAFFFAFVLLIPFGTIALLGVYVRRGFAKSLDAEGVNAPLGRKFQWGKLYYVDHVTKHFRAGGAGGKVKDNQLELVFEGGKLIIPPLIRERARIWELINSMPAEVRDDGVPRAGRAPRVGGHQIRTEEDLRMLLESLDGPRNQG
jgi:hypothetical protein